MKSRFKVFVFALFAAVALLATPAKATSLMENLGRGVVAVRTSPTDIYVSWRMLGTDPASISFNLYRSTNGGAPVLVNAAPITGATLLTDTTADLTQANAYFVRPILGGVEQPASAPFTVPANAPTQQYLRVPLHRPPAGTTPVGDTYTYSPADSSAADLDGDGEYEIIVKWDPSNAQDNSNDGYTGNVLLDGYKIDGTLLWRVDLGRNIRAGAHYTQFLVYDFDGDGKAELVCKTAPNTKDGTGTFIGQPGKFLGTPSAPIDHNADYRNSGGYILTGPEFFTIFSGQTGAEIVTTNYIVPRNNNPASSDVTAWGDNYGNRVDRFLACVAYLDGQRPSLVLCRGYYTRAVLAAWDFRNGQLTQRWVADTGNNGTANPLSAWRGQGSHNLTVGDVDDDGRDEITYGAAAFDDDGTGLYSTLRGHGDALHMSVMDPTRGGKQVWMSHEDPGSYGTAGLEFRDARTGALIFGVDGNGADIGRAAAGDIDPRYLGYEMWGARGGLMTASGTQVSSGRPGQMNFMVWWDGDLLRELLDGTTVSKWDWNTSTASPILAPSGVGSNNSTKSTPNLSADILGDWREEIIWRETTNDALRIYTTTIPTTYRIPTLMHDRQYRLAIAWQNVAYNQPPHPGFYLGEGMSGLPVYDIVTSAAALPALAPAAVSITRFDPSTGSTGLTNVTFRVTFNTAVSGVDASDFTVATTGSLVGSVTSVNALSPFAYNVTVGSITGTGTIRLDLKATGTGITGPGGVPISGGFTGGQTYARATLAWINHTSGGLWSNVSNWDGDVIADEVGDVPIFGNFDLTTDNTVVLDGPRTVSGATFGDTDVSTPASWKIDDNGIATNTLTLDAVSGQPVITVNALGTDASVTLAVPLAGSEGLNKAGPGTLVLTRPSPLLGSLTVSGTLRLDEGGSLALGNAGVNINGASGAKLAVNGGSYVAAAMVTLGSGKSIAGTFEITSGTAELNGGIRTNNESGSVIRFAGGTVTAADVSIGRNAAGTIDYRSGFIVTGGVATVRAINLGTTNSTAAMSVEGGALTATGAVTIGNNANSTRGAGLRVTGGSFTSTDTASGVVLTRASGNVTVATFSGGVSSIEKFMFGYNSSVIAGSGTLTVNGGTVYVGPGGFVKNAASSYAAAVNLSSGVLGAKANWATSLPMTLTTGGMIELRAADAEATPFTIALDGVLSGDGSLVKSGAGTLTLSAVNTFTGSADVNAGVLNVTGSLASGGAVTVNAGGTLAGNGTVAKPVMLNSGGSVDPSGPAAMATLTAASLTWNGDGALAFDLGANGTSDVLALTGALTKGTAGTFNVALTAREPLAPGNLYTVATFASTTLAPTDVATTGLPTGFAAHPILTPTELHLVIIARPVITSPTTATTVYGTAFSYAITANNGPTSFSATGLPAGLTLDSATGVISGTSGAAGHYIVTLNATNEAGTGSTYLTLDVNKAAAVVNVGTPDNSTIRRWYDGAPKPASVTTTPSSLAATFTYNGSDTVPTLPGTYDVVATINDRDYAGTATGKLVISITALVRHAPALNGDIEGSMQVLLPENLTLNGGTVVGGDLLVPGTPTVRLNGNPTLVGTKDAEGSAGPTNYLVTLNGSAMARYVVRRVDAIAMPVVQAPKAPTGTRSVSMNSSRDTVGDFATVRDLTLNGNVGPIAVPAGAYGSLTANSGGFILGVANSATPAVYELQRLTLNGNATLQIAGPVILRLAGNITLNGNVGAAANPALLTIEILDGGLTINGRIVVGATVIAPNGTVTINGGSELHGSVTADRLTINGNAVLIQAP